MAKKKRSSNPNLKYSQASKKDEGTKLLENVSNGEGSEVRAPMADSPLKGILGERSLAQQGGDATASTTSGSYCSKHRIPDLLDSGETTTKSWTSEGARLPLSLVEEVGEKVTVQVPRNGTPVPIQTTNESGILKLDSIKNLNSGPVNSMNKKMNYFTPVVKNGKTVVQLQNPDMDDEIKKWNYALVFYVIGINPSFNAARNYVIHHWKNLAMPRIFLHNDGYFILRFNSNIFNEIVRNGPYTFVGKPVVVKQWCETFDFQAEVNRCVPVWVRFPSLPLPCWSESSLSRLGSALGVPVCLDKSTSQQLRISYARMLIEIDVTRPLETTILVEGKQGGAFEQKIIYEWVPHFCSKCNHVGHNCEHKNAGQKKKKKKVEKKMGSEDSEEYS